MAAAKSKAKPAKKEPDFGGIVELSTFYMMNPRTRRGQTVRIGGEMPDGFGFNGQLRSIAKHPDSTVVLSIEGFDGEMRHYVYWNSEMWGLVL